MTEVEIEGTKKTESIKKNRTFLFLLSFLIIAFVGMLSGLTFNYLHGRHQDNIRKTDLSYIASLVDDYYMTNHYYPTLAQINAPSFNPLVRGGIDRAKFKDPSSTKDLLLSRPNTDGYAYIAKPAGCNNINLKCAKFSLTAILSSGRWDTI